MVVRNLEGRQSIRKRVLVELRIGSGPRDRSDVRDKTDIGAVQQLDKLCKTSVGMTDGEEWKLHVSPWACGSGGACPNSICLGKRWRHSRSLCRGLLHAGS